MGPMPPEPKKEIRSKDQSQGNLQRAIEAEMVAFLREQNEQLLSEVATLKQKLAQEVPSSTSSSWVQVEESGRTKHGADDRVDRVGGGCMNDKRSSSKRGGEGPRTPRAGSSASPG